jgi:hypothetical protein
VDFNLETMLQRGSVQARAADNFARALDVAHSVVREANHGKRTVPDHALESVWTDRTRDGDGSLELPRFSVHAIQARTITN